MGLTKQYLRYVPGPVFNLIGSNKANIAFVTLQGHEGRYVATAVCEHVAIWDTRKGEKVMLLQGEKYPVTYLKASPIHHHLAVGYEDGSVRVFDLTNGDCVVTFSGHKSPVSCLAFDSEGLRLVSGSKDTNVIIWDIVGEAGMFRLTGHKGPITQVAFLKDRNILVTTSKDSFIKFWDLDTQHCFKTLVGHRTEVWDFVVIKDKYIVTGCNDMELRVWEMKFVDEEDSQVTESGPKKSKSEEEGDEEGEEDDNSVLKCEKKGTILRQGKDRVVAMATDASKTILLCHGSDNTVELFKFYPDEEVKQRFSKRQRKANKKANREEDMATDLMPSLQDEVLRFNPLRVSGKAKHIDVNLPKTSEAKVLVLLGNNSFELHTIDSQNKDNSIVASARLTLPGHRSDVRALAFSSDNIAVASASAEALKIWARSSQQCLRTMQCDYALSVVFAPGDRHVLVATKTGLIQIFDVAAGRLLESVAAHDGAVWSLALTPDLRGVASGSADKSVKFWQFELIKDDVDGESHGKRLSLVHLRTLQLDEDVLCVKFSPDHKFIAASLLDSTVKIFYADTLKFFLSLYGHKFPVLSMDISYDSTLIVTGGADRNVKIWGLDFGDCHRSLFAHDDSIMAVQFVSKTHLFFSGGKDGKLKQWDADNFERIITLEGHHGEIWALSVSPDGKFVATSGHDRSLRLWHRTSEPLVLEDERETEREKEAEQQLATDQDRVVPGQNNDAEAALPGKKTVEAEKAAERLMEALNVYQDYSEELETYHKQLERWNSRKKEKTNPPALPQPHPLMVAYNATDPHKYLLEMLRRIKSTELEEALLVLPLDYVTRLLQALELLLSKGWETELISRILFFLLRLHHDPILGSRTLLPTIQELRVIALRRISHIKDLMGFNMAGLQFLQREVEEREAVQLFADATTKVRQKRQKKKRKEGALQRAVLAL